MTFERDGYKILTVKYYNYYIPKLTKGSDAMELDNTPLYLQFYNAMLRLKRVTRRIPPPRKGISHFEFMCLNVISNYTSEHPELPGIKASLLSDITQTSRPAISQHINILEEKGLICRRASRSDRRVTYLCLTESAGDFLAGMEEDAMRNFRVICDQLGQEDTRKAIAIVAKVSRIILSCSAREPAQQPQAAADDTSRTSADNTIPERKETLLQ